MTKQLYPQVVEKEKKRLYTKELYTKILQVPIGGTIFYFGIPSNPMVYVSETNGTLYINGSSDWDLELYAFYDLENEFLDQVMQLSKSIGKSISEIHDILIGYDEKKDIEKRKFYIKMDNVEIGFYYNLYRPKKTRNGIIEIIPYYEG